VKKKKKKNFANSFAS